MLACPAIGKNGGAQNEAFESLNQKGGKARLHIQKPKNTCALEIYSRVILLVKYFGFKLRRTYTYEKNYTYFERWYTR